MQTSEGGTLLAWLVGDCLGLGDCGQGPGCQPLPPGTLSELWARDLGQPCRRPHGSPRTLSSISEALSTGVPQGPCPSLACLFGQF